MSAVRSITGAAEAGASTVEFIALALVLVPFFLIVPLLGKYTDLAQTTEIASRYVAFEGTIRNSASSLKTDAELAAEVRRRFYSTSDAPIKTHDVAINIPAHRNPVWADYQGKPLLADFDADVAVETKVESKHVPAAAVFSGRAGFNLNEANLYTGRVTVRPRKLALLKPFDELDLVLSRTTSILVDAWAAASPGMVKVKVEGAGAAAYPIAPLEALGSTLGQVPPLILDPAMDVNDIDPEIVPGDRLR
ncbi:hypothetical protein [Thiobacter aerophilum]|uniref:Pilus assembly protein n=1 Tax=Thiobacter aerophilum TaxID=3121275 RepID=A0ABV0EGK8_9BURK